MPGLMLDMFYAFKITQDAEELEQVGLLFSFYAYGHDVSQVLSKQLALDKCLQIEATSI